MVAVLASDRPRRARKRRSVPRFLGAPAPQRWHVPFPLRRVALPSRQAVPLLPARPAPEQHRGGHISPTPPSPCRRGWGCCVWGDKTARLLRKSAQLLRETCRLFAQLPFIVLDAAHPADRACRTRVHTAGDNPNGKPAKNTLFPLFPPRRTLPSQDRLLLQILCKNGGFARNFEGKNERKNSPTGLFRRPFSPKTGEKRAENHKQALRIVHFVVFLTSWLPTGATISRRKTQNQHFSALLFRQCKSKTDGHFRHNTHKSPLQNEEIRENSAFL